MWATMRTINDVQQKARWAILYVQGKSDTRKQDYGQWFNKTLYMNILAQIVFRLIVNHN